MFAVPGWSLSPKSLKTQTVEDSSKKDSSVNGSVSKSSKKRKRNNDKLNVKDVNAKNLTDLWETVIEGKSKKKKVRKSKNIEKKSTANLSQTDQEKSVEPKLETLNKPVGLVAQSASQSDSTQLQPGKRALIEETEQVKKRSKKEKSKPKRIIGANSEDSAKPLHPSLDPMTELVSDIVPASKPAITLTPLQDAMRQKLISARFRHLNQTLYTTTSAHSLSLFQENPEMFDQYHEGFRRQVEVWPENPVDSYLSEIKNRGQIKGSQRNKGSKIESEIPLPRTDGFCNIADLGCGDAALSAALQPHLVKLKLKVLSFDLQSASKLVTKADIAHLPLADSSIDVAIFCLALMGTNWIDFIEEAYRILRWKGELWVAEIKSRFGRVDKSQTKVVEHSVGNRKRLTAELKRKEEQNNDAIAEIEVDGMKDKGATTNVSAFVEVLKKRGFVLASDMSKAIDLKNKMFVKIRFVKSISPIKGKCVQASEYKENVNAGTWKKKPKSKGNFIETEPEHVYSEASVLKPCVYKLR
ncbi:hypothetical protein K3495_g478 [Podosphaera aphanis]|nr:hypothetical protein K3495_g478 [Podosphaera aphanis]